VSCNHQQYMSLSGMNVLDKPKSELEALMQNILHHQIHGISFSPYTEGQGPGEQITAEQIEQRLGLISSSVRWIRSFSCTDGNELIPELAKKRGLKALVGAWLDDDLENNDKEINKLIATAKAGFVDIVAVGNEVLLRKDLSEEQLIAYIKRVKQALPDLDVGYVEAYYKFELHPNITQECDVILANCYPFWEGCVLDYSILYMKDMYRRAMKVARGKKVIVTETGWPNQGPNE